MPQLRRSLVAVSCVCALAAPSPATGQEATAAGATAAALIDAGLAPAVKRLDTAQRLANTAESRRRSDEVAHAQAVVVRMVATQELGEARHALAIARFERVEAAEELATEEAILASQLVESYRFGGPAARAEMAWRVLTESSNPLEAARSMDELSSVVDYQTDVVADRRATWRRTVRVEQRAVRRFEAALTSLAAAVADERIALAEVESEMARSVTAEEKLLEAIAALFSAEDALIEAGHDPVEVLAASGLWLSILPALEEEIAVTAAVAAPETDATEEEEPVALADRREWLENRLAALHRQVSLTPSERALREGWACPLAYGTFSNDYHYPRSHGRRHKGLDMFSTIGTPIVAVQSGFVVTRDETDRFNGEYDLGGVTVTIATRPERTWGIDEELLPENPNEPTEEWYYAHLDGIADGIEENGWVEAGQVIGYVGDTGNARGTPPHLHFGWLVGDRNVNPFPSMSVACDPDRPST